MLLVHHEVITVHLLYLQIICSYGLCSSYSAHWFCSFLGTTIQGHLWNRRVYVSVHILQVLWEHIFNKHSDDVPMLLDNSNTMKEAPNVHDHNIMHNDKVTAADFAVDVPVSEKPKLYNKAMYLLKLKHEQRLSHKWQLMVWSVILLHYFKNS